MSFASSVKSVFLGMLLDIRDVYRLLIGRWKVRQFFKKHRNSNVIYSNPFDYELETNIDLMLSMTKSERKEYERILVRLRNNAIGG